MLLSRNLIQIKKYDKLSYRICFYLRQEIAEEDRCSQIQKFISSSLQLSSLHTLSRYHTYPVYIILSCYPLDRSGPYVLSYSIISRSRPLSLTDKIIKRSVCTYFIILLVTHLLRNQIASLIRHM